MTLTIGKVLMLIGVACFVLAALNVAAAIGWFPLGWAFVVGGWLLDH